MKHFVLKDKMGCVIRSFHSEARKIFLVYRPKKGRLDFCAAPDFFKGEKTFLMDKFEVNALKAGVPVPLFQGSLERCEVSSLSLREPLFSLSMGQAILQQRSFFSLILIFYACCAGLLGFGILKLAPQKETKKALEQTVKILPVSKKAVSSANARVKTAFLPGSRSSQKKSIKRSLKRMGALSALSNLKNSFQKRSLNLRPSPASSGSGFRTVSGQAVQGTDSFHGQGMIAATLGTDGSIRGGAQGGSTGRNLSGYGKVTLAGTGQEGGEMSFSSGESGKAGFDFSPIENAFIDHIEEIKDCYGKALETEPNLKGLFKIYFQLNQEGRAFNTKIHPLSETRSPAISSCIFDLVRKMPFPSPPQAGQGIEYTFNLSALDTEGG